MESYFLFSPLSCSLLFLPIFFFFFFSLTQNNNGRSKKRIGWAKKIQICFLLPPLLPSIRSRRFHSMCCCVPKTERTAESSRTGKMPQAISFLTFFFFFLFFFFFPTSFILFYVLLFASHSSHILVFLLCFAFRVWPFLVWLPEVFMFLFNESKQKTFVFFSHPFSVFSVDKIFVFIIFFYFFFPPRKAILVDRPRQWNVDIPFQSQNDKSRAECSTRKKQNIKTNKKPV